MRVYVLTSVSVVDGVLCPYVSQVFKTRRKARERLLYIKKDELIPEYVEIRGYLAIKDTPDVFTAIHKRDMVHLYIDGVDVK